MKKYLVLFMVFILTVFFINSSVSKADDYRLTVLAKRFATDSFPEKIVTVKFYIYTEGLIDRVELNRGIQKTWNIHKQFCNIFKVNGWRPCGLLQPFPDIGRVIIRQEERLKGNVIFADTYIGDFHNHYKNRKKIFSDFAAAIFEKTEERIVSAYGFKR